MVRLKFPETRFKTQPSTRQRTVKSMQKSSKMLFETGIESWKNIVWFPGVFTNCHQVINS